MGALLRSSTDAEQENFKLNMRIQTVSKRIFWLVGLVFSFTAIATVLSALVGGPGLILTVAVTGMATLALASVLTTRHFKRLAHRLMSDLEDARSVQQAQSASKHAHTDLLQQQALAKLQADKLHGQMLAMVDALAVVIYQYEVERGKPARFIFVSDCSKDVFGFSAQEMMADPALCWRDVHPHDAKVACAAFDKATERAFSGEDGATISLQLRHLVGGKERWLRTSARSGGFQSDGKILWNGYAEDITDQKAAEAEIVRAGYQFRMLWEKTPDCYLFFGAQGVTACNDSALKLLGVAAQSALLGHTFGSGLLATSVQAGGDESVELAWQLRAFVNAVTC